jgi:transcriptional regulator with XRE-family HTH domain
LRLTASKPVDPAYPTELKTLGDHIRKRRLELRLFQREAARLIGVSKKTLENWETKRTNPDLRALPGVIAFLGDDPTWAPAVTLGERLRAARRARGLSSRALARQFGVDQSTVLHWERGLSVPWVRYLPRILALIGEETVSPDTPLGERIRAYRRKNGLTQRQLAEQIGLKAGGVSDWELGKHPPCTRLRTILETLLRGQLDPSGTESAP